MGWGALEEGSLAQSAQAELSGALKEGRGTLTTTDNAKTLMEMERFPVIGRLPDKNIKFLCLCLEFKHFNVVVIMHF